MILVYYNETGWRSTTYDPTMFVSRVLTRDLFIALPWKGKRCEEYPCTSQLDKWTNSDGQRRRWVIACRFSLKVVALTDRALPPAASPSVLSSWTEPYRDKFFAPFSWNLIPRLQFTFSIGNNFTILYFFAFYLDSYFIKLHVS